jgi:tetratricopeptide (TPR) repeat protein
LVAVVGGKPLVLEYRSRGDASIGTTTDLASHPDALSTTIISSAVPGQSTGLTPTRPSTQPSPFAAYSWKFDLPKPPAERVDCADSALMKTESKRRVNLGNDATVRGEHKTALNEYKAAISVNRCNAFAWADVGALALTVSRPEIAIGALKVAVKLHPRHYTAWVNLGKVYEEFGQRQLAQDAYAKALAINPNIPHARQGLQRTR